MHRGRPAHPGTSLSSLAPTPSSRSIRVQLRNSALERLLRAQQPKRALGPTVPRSALLRRRAGRRMKGAPRSRLRSVRRPLQMALSSRLHLARHPQQVAPSSQLCLVLQPLQTGCSSLPRHQAPRWQGMVGQGRSLSPARDSLHSKSLPRTPSLQGSIPNNTQLERVHVRLANSQATQKAGRHCSGMHLQRPQRSHSSSQVALNSVRGLPKQAAGQEGLHSKALHQQHLVQQRVPKPHGPAQGRSRRLHRLRTCHNSLDRSRLDSTLQQPATAGGSSMSSRHVHSMCFTRYVDFLSLFMRPSPSCADIGS